MIFFKKTRARIIRLEDALAGSRSLRESDRATVDTFLRRAFDAFDIEPERFRSDQFNQLLGEINSLRIESEGR